MATIQKPYTNWLGMNYRTKGSVRMNDVIGIAWFKDEATYRRALAIYKEVLGPTSQEVAETLEEYAELFRRAGRTREADSLDVRAQRILDASDPAAPVP